VKLSAGNVKLFAGRK